MKEILLNLLVADFRSRLGLKEKKMKLEKIILIAMKMKKTSIILISTRISLLL